MLLLRSCTGTLGPSGRSDCLGNADYRLYILNNLGCEKLAEELQDVTIGNPLSHQVNNESVKDVVEEGLDVNLDDNPAAIAISF